MTFASYDDLIRAVLAILPNSYFVELDSGEIAILTGLIESNKAGSLEHMFTVTESVKASL